MGRALSELTTAASAFEADGHVDAGGSAPAVVTIDHVWKQFGAFTAVADADFSIARGEFFAMLGPSGCGKTTTLRMIAGFEQPTKGRVLIDGKDVSRVPPYRRPVNTVFQQYALFPHMTVFDNVAFGPRSRKVADAEVRRSVSEILEVVRLGELAKRKPAQLSGGQQQRVALARALVNLPRALLLDEPLGALDLKLRQAMQLELKRIQRETGITFIFVTHDQEEALTMSDRIAVMSAGEVEQIGTPVDIYQHPETTFVAGFIGEANLLAATIESVDGDRATVSLAGAGRAPAPTAGRTYDVGRTVTLMIRPERLDVSVDEPSDPAVPRVRTTVVDLVFQGPVVRFDLRSPDGRPLVAKVGAEARLPLLRPGDELWASWPADASYLVPDEPPPAHDPLASDEALAPAGVTPP